MSNKRHVSIYIDKDTVKRVKLLLLNRENSASFSQVVENLLNYTTDQHLKGCDKWLNSVLTKISVRKEGKPQT